MFCVLLHIDDFTYIARAQKCYSDSYKVPIEGATGSLQVQALHLHGAPGIHVHLTNLGRLCTLRRHTGHVFAQLSELHGCPERQPVVSRSGNRFTKIKSSSLREIYY